MGHNTLGNMGKFYFWVCIGFISCLSISITAQTTEQINWIRSKTNLVGLLELQNEFIRLQNADRRTVLHFARRNNIPLTYEQNGAFAELQKILPDGTPLYYTTYNVDSAKSTRTNYLHINGGLGLDLMGQNMTAYVWDGGLALASHQEYDGPGGNNRFSKGDNSTALHYHAAHVTGTIISSGVVPNAKGMAPYAKAIGFDWNSDISEATQNANSNGMLVSNHSYGYESFTQNGGYALPSYFPGAYIADSRSWDQIMYNAPYYLMVVAAGNDGYDPITTSPLGGLTGYDKLTGHATSKNNLVVANAQDAVINSAGELVSVTINGSSSQGPTDDLRIKPDITGNGTSVFSTFETSPTAYNSITGTSMASPNVSGSLLLLQEHYQKLNNGEFMRAATLKGLALHTADDAGPAGPDAVYGWGLLNAKKAAETISLKNSNSLIYELNLTNNSPQTINVVSNGIQELRASISWTDRPGNTTTNLNDPTPRLVHDLDIRVKKGNSTYFPWRLTGVTTNGKGDNNVDPFERVDVPNASGNYTIEITHKGTLPYGGQNFSLIITGVTVNTCNAAITQINTGIACGITSAPISVQGNQHTTEMHLYTTPFGGTPVATINGNSGTFQTPEISGDSSFYISAGNTNCESNRYPVHIMFAPAPTEITINRTNTPEILEGCAYDVVKLTADGGIEDSYVYYEGFSAGTYSNWAYNGPNNNLLLGIADANYANGAPPEVVLYYNSGNSQGSWSQFPYNPYSNERMAINLEEYDDVRISFRQMIDVDLYSSYNRNFYLDVSTDGVNYTPVWSLTSVNQDRPAEQITVDLSQYDRVPTLYFQFRYTGHSMGLDYWFLDDIEIKGKRQNPITWMPIEGLFLDEMKTIPYDGGHAFTVYAAPDSPQTYKAIVYSTQNDCTKENTVNIENYFTHFIAESGNWDNSENWSQDTIPTLQNCVRVPAGSILQVNLPDAEAKNILIEAGGKLEIKEGNTLTVAEEITNLASKEDFLIEHDANLVQLDDEITNTGFIQVKKEFNFQNMANPSNDRKQYNFVISPLIGQSIKTIYPGQPNVLQFNEDANFFTSTPGTYEPGKGFAVREPSKAAVPESTIMADFFGTPFNGVLEFELKYTNNSNPDPGYNLVGNPYPSTLDISKVYSRNQDLIEPEFYFWDNRGNEVFVQQGSDYQGDHYAYFNAAAGGGTGVAATATSGDLKIPTKYTSVGTAFMVRAKPDANLSKLYMDNSMRTGSFGPTFTGKNELDESETDRFWLTMTTPDNATTMMAVAYFEGGNNEFSLDDSKSFGSSDDIYSILDQFQLKIQGKSEFHRNDTIRLGYKAYENGHYTIRLYDQEGVFNENQSIFLWDKLNNLYTRLNTNEYRFRTTAGEFNDRFFIVYKMKNIKLSTKSNLVNVYKNQQNIQFTSSEDPIESIEIFNIHNKLVYKQDRVNTKSFVIPSHLFGKEVLFIQLITDKGELVSKKYMNK